MGNWIGWRGLRRAGMLGAGLAMSAGLQAAPAHAQQARWLPSVRWDNDGFNFWVHPAHRPDEEYTNGLRITMQAHSAPWWGPRFASRHVDCAADPNDTGTCLATTLTLAQEMYTPHLARVPYSTPDWERERPYFGWLYLAGQGHVVTRRSLRTFGLTLGVTGPPSGAQVLHAAAHIVNRRFARTVSGWETQVGFEPGVIGSYRHTVMALRLGSRRAAMLQVMPSVGVSLGNVYSGADVGGLARVGLNLTHPWDPRNWDDRRPFELWAQAGGTLEYVARNMSLDGTLVNPDRRVQRVPGVPQVELGAGVRLAGLSFEYRIVTRGQEYLTGPRKHTFSSLRTAVTVVP